MIVDVDRAAGVVTKRAEMPAEEARLGYEAEVLRRAQHPGVVQLIGFNGRDELRVAAVAGHPVKNVGQLPVAEIAALGTEVATILADLHDIGVVHGALTADHVLIGPSGRPVLCGFGHGEGAESEDDVAALGHLLASLAPPQSGALFDNATCPDPRRRPTARALARHLAAATSDQASRPRRPVRPLILGSVGVAVLLLGAVFWHPRSAARRAGEIPTATGRFRLSEAGDLVVLGRWTCTATAFPALLRSTTGEVWVWTAWPTSAVGVTGRLVSRIGGAFSLRVVSPTSGCDMLIVTRAGGPPVAINPAWLARGTD